MNTKSSGSAQDNTGYCGFVVGQHVVCINDENRAPAGVTVLEQLILPEKGKVYTVRALVIGVLGRAPCLSLVEIPDQTVRIEWNGKPWFGDVIFKACDFRPLKKLKVEDFMSAPVDGERASA